MISLPRRSCALRRRHRAAIAAPEAMEERRMLSGATLGPLATIPPAAQPTIQIQLAAGAAAWSESSPWGYSPQQIASAYGFNGIRFGSTPGLGAGQTIAIVDAYNDPALVDSNSPSFESSDLAQFDRQYGLPDPPSFLKVGQSGSASNLPGSDPAGSGVPGNWAEEEALDVEWAHAMAPAASIVLVETQSSNDSDLFAGARTAAAIPGVSVVSMSWGSAEFSGETGYDPSFTTPAGHAGVTFVAATGDHGAPGMYPAYSPNVLAVGGTSLTIPTSGGYGGESGWSNGGGGTSLFEARPSYQAGVQSTGHRTIPDVAAVADPNTGASVYDSYDGGASGPWMRSGGTSLAAPIWAALVAIADQGRASAGGSALDGVSQVIPSLYGLPAADFHDVTTGGNGAFASVPGYDQSTGLGTPVASLIAPALAYHDLASWLAIESPPPATIVAGQPFGLTIAVVSPDGTIDTTYQGSITITMGSDPSGTGLGGTLTEPVVGGVAVFSGLTLTQAALGDTIDATAGGGAAPASTSPIAVVPGAANRVVEIHSTPVGHGEISVTVAVVDAYGNLVTSYNSGVEIVGRGRHARNQPVKLAIAQGGYATFARLRLISGHASSRRINPAVIEGLVAEAVLFNGGPLPVISMHAKNHKSH